MKKYCAIIICSSILLVLALSWGQIPQVESLSLFQANLKKEVLVDLEHQDFSLENNIDLKRWMVDKDKQKSVIETEELREEKRLVKGITFYNSQQEIDNRIDVLSKEEIVVNKKTGLQLVILPGVLMDSSRQIEQGRIKSELTTDLGLKQQLGFDVNYRLSQNLNVNTGYYLTGEQKQDIVKLSEGDNRQLGFSSEEVATNNIQQIGINYNTSDHTSVFANYLEEEASTDDDSTTTVIGVEYNDDAERITLQHQIDDSKEQKVNSTGLELGVNEFGKLKAVYTMIEDNSDQESTETSEAKAKEKSGEKDKFKSQLLDLGLKLRVSDDTSLKIGYQVSDQNEAGNEESGSQEIWEKLKPKEANIELKVKF